MHNASPTVYTNCLSPRISEGQQHPAELHRRQRNGVHPAVDYDHADLECRQHRATMQRAGAMVHLLGVNREMPDGVFIQDNAYIVPDDANSTWVALGASMGPTSRRAEVEPVLACLAEYGLEVRRFPVDLWGCIEYGDVFPPMQLGSERVIFVGRREFDDRVPCRTDDSGVDWFRQQVEPLGYRVEEFEFKDTLHATSIGSAVGMTPNQRPLVLIDGSRASLGEFARYDIDVPQLDAQLREQYAWGLNTVRLNGSVVMQSGFPPVRELLTSYGFTPDHLLETPWSQLPGVDGSLSCCCIGQLRSI